jgi:hypothetical protein
VAVELVLLVVVLVELVEMERMLGKRLVVPAYLIVLLVQQ